MKCLCNRWVFIQNPDTSKEIVHFVHEVHPIFAVTVEDIDLSVTRQEGPGYSYGHYQKPGAKLEDDGPEMG